MSLGRPAVWIGADFCYNGLEMVSRRLFIVGLAFCLFSCALRHPIRTEIAGAGETQTVGDLSGSSESRNGVVFQSGVASWYGIDFHGKSTADGEVYDMDRLTAAHQTLPFHTLVEVLNLGNLRKTVVRINDRGPFLKNRIIDLSRKAARRLGIEETGTAPVQLRIVSFGTALPPLPKISGSGTCLQAGAFANTDNARVLVSRLGEGIPDIPFTVIAEDDLYKVLSGPFPSPEAAAEGMKRLYDLGFDCRIRDCPAK